MNEITIVGVDALHAVARDGRLVLLRTVSRGKLLKTVARLPPSLIGLEPCPGAHEWARFQSLGHTVRLTAPAS
jgi:transposase